MLLKIMEYSVSFPFPRETECSNYYPEDPKPGKLIADCKHYVIGGEAATALHR